MLTNFDDDLTVIYKGQTKYEFKEGETLVITAYAPDLNNRKKVEGMHRIDCGHRLLNEALDGWCRVAGQGRRGAQQLWPQCKTIITVVIN